MLFQIKKQALLLKEKLGFKKAFVVLMLAALDVFIFAAPYYIQTFVVNMFLILHISQTNYEQILGIFGIAFLVGLIPSGFLADKLNAKWLCSAAAGLTGILLLWWNGLVLFGAKTSETTLFIQYIIIYSLWGGVSTSMLFWAPLWKLVSQQTTPKNIGFVNGVQGTFVGLVGLIFIFGGGILVAFLKSQYNLEIAFVIYTLFIALVLLLLSFGIIFFVENSNNYPQNSNNFSLKELLNLLKKPKIWLMGIGNMGSYIHFGIVIRYLYIQIFANVVQIPTFLITIFGGLNTYLLRLLISQPFGRFADRKAKSYVFLITTIIFFILVFDITVLVLLPNSAEIFSSYSVGYKWFLWVSFILLFLMGGACNWAISSIRFSQSVEIDRPKNSYGSSVALISFLTFSPDAFYFHLNIFIRNSVLSSNATEAEGYKLGLLIAIVFVFIGFCSSATLYLLNKREVKKLGKTSFRWREHSI